MSAHEPSQPIRHIIVALDASPASIALLEAAAELAARFNTELVGLFVEDANLINLAHSSFFREISHLTATARQLGLEEVERQLRAQANQMQRALTLIAARQQVPATFRVVRGQVVAELLKAAAETDLIVLGRARQSVIPRQQRLGSTARVFLRQAPRLTLVLQNQARLGFPILVVYDQSAAAQRALQVAARLSQTRDAQLTVMLLSETVEAAQQAEAQVAAWLQAQNLRARYHWLASANLTKLGQIVTAERGQLLILPGANVALRGEALLALLDELRTSVLVVQ